jgi:hypothetical protein
MISLNRKSFFQKLWAISAVFSLGLLLWTNPKFAGSFSAGCVGMIINFYVLFSLLEGIFEGENTKATVYICLLMGKFAGLGLGIYLMVRFLKIDIIGFGLGFFLVAISATYATASMKKSSTEHN